MCRTGCLSQSSGKRKRFSRPLRDRLRKAGFEPKIISAGSTPTAVFAESWEGVTEVRCAFTASLTS